MKKWDLRLTDVRWKSVLVGTLLYLLTRASFARIANLINSRPC